MQGTAGVAALLQREELLSARVRHVTHQCPLTGSTNHKAAWTGSARGMEGMGRRRRRRRGKTSTGLQPAGVDGCGGGSKRLSGREGSCDRLNRPLHSFDRA